MARIDDIDSARRQAEAAQRSPALALVGISHHSAPFEALEKAALDEPGARQAIRNLLEHGSVAESAVVATCNRTELYMVVRDYEQAVNHARKLLKDSSVGDSGAVYVKFGRDVAAHLFRVAAGVDSLMVGEVQVLGQVKRALGIAEEEQGAGTVLGKLFATSLRAGKRARSETDIGQGAVSVSYAALGLAQKIYTNLTDHTLLIVGAGETGTLAARHFAEAGIGRLWIANRTMERAERLAAELGGRAVPFESIGESLAEVDIAVTATAASEPIVDRAMVEAARSGRGRQRLVLIDLALPRDVDPAVNELEGVFVHDMAALDSIVQRNLERRRREIPRVEGIVAQEVERYENWLTSLDAGPTIRDLRQHFEAIRTAELDALSKHLDPKQLGRVERTTRAMVNKLLHQPLVQLRRPRPGTGDSQTLAAAVRTLFGLDASSDDPTSDDPTGDEDPDAGKGSTR